MISPAYFQSDFCKLEMQTAIAQQKPIAVCFNGSKFKVQEALEAVWTSSSKFYFWVSFLFFSFFPFLFTLFPLAPVHEKQPAPPPPTIPKCPSSPVFGRCCLYLCWE